VGLKVRTVSRLSAPVTFSDGTTVEVRALTVIQRERVADSATKGGEFDRDKWAEEAAEVYIGGWSCMPASFVRERVELEDDPATDSDGYVPYDKETARDLWRHADPARFSRKIQDASAEILRSVEAEKDRQKNG